MKDNYEFERSTPESVGIPSEAIENLLDELETTEHCEPHGLMIIRHGKICAEGWWAPYAAGLPHQLYSLTKTYTGTAVGIAYTEKLLVLDDKVIKYFPEYASLGSGKNKEVTIRQALSMASGKPEYRCDTGEWKKHFFEIPFTAKPGSKFEYSCEDTHILMAIVQRVSGQGLHEYLKLRLFDRIGIDADRLKWIYMPDGSEVGAGGLFATTEDSLRLMKLYLQDGVWDGERILASDYVAQATSKQIENRGHGYGFQIHMGSRKRSYYGSGALGQFAIAVPDLDMIIVFYHTGAYVNPAGTEFKNSFRSAEYQYKVLGNIFKVFIPSVNNNKLPENSETNSRLVQRMRRLSLGNPEYHPIPEMAQKISGNRYRIKKGTFTIRSAIWNHTTNNEPFYKVTGLEWFSLEFGKTGICIFSFLEHGKKVTLQVGLDGTRRLDSYCLEKTSIDMVVLDGAWVHGDTFHLNARWIETCYSITVEFKFISEKVELSAVRLRGDYKAHPLRRGNVIAELID